MKGFEEFDRHAAAAVWLSQSLHEHVNIPGYKLILLDAKGDPAVFVASVGGLAIWFSVVWARVASTSLPWVQGHRGKSQGRRVCRHRRRIHGGKAS